MIWVFIASLLFGGGLVGMGLLGKDFDHDASGFDHDVGFLALFSLRNLAWAAFAFGGMGTLAVLTGRSTTVTLASSIGFGLATFLVVSLLFRLLRASEAETSSSDSMVIGAIGELVLPFNDDGLGVVSVRAGGQQLELPARRSEEAAGMDSSSFASCRIDFIDGGVAVVTPDIGQ